MKKLIGLCLLLMSGMSYAVVPPVDPHTPAAIQALGDGLHIGDNGALLYMRDSINNQHCAGSATAIYKKFYLSADGILGYVANVPGSNGFYAAGGRLWAGELLYENVPLIRDVADRAALAAKLLQYGTVGGWGTRDFQNGIWRAGWDAGFTLKF